MALAHGGRSWCAAMVILLATGAVPAFVASLRGAAIVLLRVLSAESAYRSISWTTVVLIGAMFALSRRYTTAVRPGRSRTRLSRRRGGGPHALLVALFVLTAVIGQLISNTATALIVIPIAISAAGDLAVSPSGADDRRGRRDRVVSDTDRDPGEHDGAGTRRLPVRGLLEARAVLLSCSSPSRSAWCRCSGRSEMDVTAAIDEGAALVFVSTGHLPPAQRWCAPARR